MTKSCHWYLKGKNFESNSQPVGDGTDGGEGCHWYLKGKNFESNSQRSPRGCPGVRVVIGTSKVKISKAIHNVGHIAPRALRVVIGTSKVKISKAIHNKVHR